jgi:hypothetical protein
MLTQTEWAKLNNAPALASGITEVFALNNPVVANMPFINIAGNAYRYETELTLPGVGFRAIGGSYTEATGTLNPTTETLCIVGGDSDYDVAHIKQQTGSYDTRAVYDALTAKAITLKHLVTFFDGDTDSDANSFDGINKRLTGAQVISAATNGAVLTLDMLDALIDAVRGSPTILLMNKATRRSIIKLARGSSVLTVGADQFGREVSTYNGLPFGIVEDDASGTDILGFDETQGTSSATCSVYAVKFGPDAMHGIQTEPLSAGIRDLGELNTKPALRTRMEWYSGLVIKDGKSAARLKGVLAG